MLMGGTLVLIEMAIRGLGCVLKIQSGRTPVVKMYRRGVVVSLR